MWKIKNNLVPISLTSWFQINECIIINYTLVYTLTSYIYSRNLDLSMPNYTSLILSELIYGTLKFQMNQNNLPRQKPSEINIKNAC